MISTSIPFKEQHKKGKPAVSGSKVFVILQRMTGLFKSGLFMAQFPAAGTRTFPESTSGLIPLSSMTLSSSRLMRAERQVSCCSQFFKTKLGTQHSFVSVSYKSLVLGFHVFAFHCLPK